MALPRTLILMLVATLSLAGCTGPDPADTQVDEGEEVEEAPSDFFTRPAQQTFGGAWEAVVASSSSDTSTSVNSVRGDFEADLYNATGAEWTFVVTASSTVQEWRFCLMDLEGGVHDGACAQGATGATLSLTEEDLEGYSSRIRPNLAIVPTDPAPVALDIAATITWEAVVDYR